MSLFQNVLLLGVKPLNGLETALLAFLKEELAPEAFEQELAKAKVVLLLKEAPPESAAGGPGIKPLVLDGADGRPALCVFTHPDRSLAMAKKCPEFPYALQAEFSWVLKVTPPGFGMQFNTGTFFSTEVAPEGVDQMRPGLP